MADLTASILLDVRVNGQDGAQRLNAEVGSLNKRIAEMGQIWKAVDVQQKAAVATLSRYKDVQINADTADRKRAATLNKVEQGLAEVTRLTDKSTRAERIRIGVIEESEKREVASLRKRNAEWKATINTIESATGRMKAGFQSVAIASGAMLTAGVGAAVAVGKALLDTNASFEALDRSITALTGDTGAFAKLQKYALLSPLSSGQTVTGARNLLGAQKRLSVDQILKRGGIMDTLTRVAAGTGDENGPRDLTEVIRQFQGIYQGNWRSREMIQNQVGKEFLGSIGIGWDSKKNRPAGLDASTGPQFFDRIIAGLWEKWKNFDVETLLKTKITNIQDAFKFMFYATSKAFDDFAKPLMDKFQAVILRLFDFAESPGFKKAAQTLQTEVLGPMADRIMGFLDNLATQLEKHPEALTNAVMGFVNGLKLLGEVFVGAQIGAVLAGTLNGLAAIAELLMVSNPLGLVVLATVLGAAAIAFGLAKGKLDEFTGSTKDNSAAVEALTGSVKSLTSAFSALAGTWDRIGGNTAVANTLSTVANGFAVLLNSVNNFANSSAWEKFLAVTVPGYAILHYGNQGIQDTISQQHAAEYKQQKYKGMTDEEIGRAVGAKGRMRVTIGGKPTMMSWADIQSYIDQGGYAPIRGVEHDLEYSYKSAGAKAIKEHDWYRSLGYDERMMQSAREGASSGSKPDVGAKGPAGASSSAPSPPPMPPLSEDIEGGGSKTPKTASSGEQLIDILKQVHIGTKKLVGGTCAWAAAERLRALGIPVPEDKTTTEGLSQWLQSSGWSMVKIGSAQVGDLLFKKDITDTTSGGGPNGMPDHTGFLSSTSGGHWSILDNKGNHKINRRQYDYALRPPGGSIDDMLGATPTPTLEELAAQVYAMLQGIDSHFDRTRTIGAKKLGANGWRGGTGAEFTLHLDDAGRPASIAALDSNTSALEDLRNAVLSAADKMARVMGLSAPGASDIQEFKQRQWTSAGGSIWDAPASIAPPDSFENNEANWTKSDGDQCGPDGCGIRWTSGPKAGQLVNPSDAGKSGGGGGGASKGAKQGIDPYQAIGTAMTDVAALISAKGNDLVGAIAKTAQDLLSMVGAGQFGPIISGGLAIFNALKAKKHHVTVDSVDSTVVTKPENLSISLAANPSSRLFAGMGVGLGAGFNVHVSYAPGADKMVNAMVNRSLGIQQQLDGRF